MVFNATFSTISVISWWSVLFVEETGVPSENSPYQTLSTTPRHGRDSNSERE
jgi:hypothetical protein